MSKIDTPRNLRLLPVASALSLRNKGGSRGPVSVSRFFGRIRLKHECILVNPVGYTIFRAQRAHALSILGNNG